MRMSGLPARGWYPKQRHTRTTASTEHLDRLHQGSLRAWEMSNSGGKRKPTTLPPNMTPPKFFNSKSPREALRRVTSLLINRKGTQCGCFILVLLKKLHPDIKQFRNGFLKFEKMCIELAVTHSFEFEKSVTANRSHFHTLTILTCAGLSSIKCHKGKGRKWN